MVEKLLCLLACRCFSADPSWSSLLCASSQAENGDLIFLHPFNTSCLLAEFEGDVSKFPRRLTGKVVEVETVRVDDTTRRTYDFLSHLPEHCEVMLVELDLRKIVSQQTLDRFRSEMKRRANRRKVLARKAVMTAQADADAQEAIRLQQQDLKVRLPVCGTVKGLFQPTFARLTRGFISPTVLSFPVFRRSITSK